MKLLNEKHQYRWLLQANEDSNGAFSLQELCHMKHAV